MRAAIADPNFVDARSVFGYFHGDFGLEAEALASESYIPGKMLFAKHPRETAAKRLELPPIIPCPGIDSPVVHEIPDRRLSVPRRPFAAISG